MSPRRPRSTTGTSWPSSPPWPGADPIPRIHARIVREPLDGPAILARVGTSGDGAVVLVLGTVRDHHEGRVVEGILYEGYEPMALELLRRLAAEAAERTGVTRIAVEHRLGELAVGEVSVAVAVSAPHRAEAFEAASGLMTELKRTLPIWKKERFVGGETSWVTGIDPRLPAEGPPDPSGEGEEP